MGIGIIMSIIPILMVILLQHIICRRVISAIIVSINMQKEWPMLAEIHHQPTTKLNHLTSEQIRRFIGC